MFFRRAVKISVCVPVFGTEDSLGDCLKSVSAQDFKDFELIVVDDGSEAGTAEEIVSKFKKTVKFPVKFIRHQKNLGLVEARRTAIFEAKGEYIFNLDSDDTIPANCLSELYENAAKTNSEIVHGGAVLDRDSERVQKKIDRIVEGTLTGTEILDSYLLTQSHNGFLWGKLIKKELYLDALNHIPPMFCIMAEDFLQYFWICYEAAKQNAKYSGVKKPVYNYFIAGGISSRVKITDLARWEKVCSTAGVFTAIFTELEESGENAEKVITETHLEKIREFCRSYLSNNIIQWKTAVGDSIKDEAYKTLCDYWGEDFVKLAMSRQS